MIQQYRDILPEQLPKGIPPKRVVEHSIKIELGSKPSYWSCSELVPCILFYCAWVASDGESDPRIVRLGILDGYWDITE